MALVLIIVLLEITLQYQLVILISHQYVDLVTYPVYNVMVQINTNAFHVSLIIIYMELCV